MVIFEPFLTTFKAAGEITKIGSSLQSNHLNQAKIVEIPY